MSYRFIGCLIILLILISGVSCTRLEESKQGGENLVPIELERTDSIPASWGNLVSVSSVPGIEDWAQLWFQDDEGIIRIVPYNMRKNFLYYRAQMIRRD